MDKLFLSSVPQVRLTLETASPDGSCSTSDASCLLEAKVSPPVSQLVRLLWGEDTAELQMAIGHFPHIVMYLSLDLDSASSKEEVSGCRWKESLVFSHPCCSSITRKLAFGLFFKAIKSRDSKCFCRQKAVVPGWLGNTKRCSVNSRLHHRK